MISSIHNLCNKISLVHSGLRKCYNENGRTDCGPTMLKYEGVVLGTRVRVPNKIPDKLKIKQKSNKKLINSI